MIKVAFFTQTYCLFNFLGTTGHPADLDPELLSALQNVSGVVCRFVDNNPTAWAPLICEVKYSLYDYIACPLQHYMPRLWYLTQLSNFAEWNHFNPISSQIINVFQWSLNLLGQVVTRNNGRRGKLDYLLSYRECLWPTFYHTVDFIYFIPGRSQPYHVTQWGYSQMDAVSCCSKVDGYCHPL